MWNDRRLPGPCKGCTTATGRSETCHFEGHCAKYDAFKAELKEFNEQKRKEEREKQDLKALDMRRGKLFGEGVMGRRKR